MRKQIGLMLAVGLTALATGCQQDDVFGLSFGGASADKIEMTQVVCDARSGFAFVEGGDFIAGSDRTERDYAYRISAEGCADSTTTVAEAEAGYRKQGWFDREPERRRVNLPSFCMSENLITNVDYRNICEGDGSCSTRYF